MSAALPQSWNRYLGGEFEASYMRALRDFLNHEKRARKVIYPHSSNGFRAFELTPLDQVRVVILGQEVWAEPTSIHIVLQRAFPT